MRPLDRLRKIGVRLDVPGVDWDQIAEIVEDAYRTVAPKRLVAELDGRRDRSS